MPNITYQAALDTKRKVDLSGSQLSEYIPSSAFDYHYRSAVSHLTAAASALNAAQKGKEGQLALSMDLLLKEYGVAYTRSRATSRVPWNGLTLDTIARYQSLLNLAKNIGGPYAWVRIVIDRGTSPSTYAPALAYAKQLGVKVMRCPVDSSYAKGYNREGYFNRVKLFVDAWEVANEANGNWLGTGMAEKIAEPNFLDSASVWENWITGRPTPRKTGGILTGTIPPPRPAVGLPPSILPLRWAILTVSAGSSGGILQKRWFRTSCCRIPYVPWSGLWITFRLHPVLLYPCHKI